MPTVTIDLIAKTATFKTDTDRARRDFNKSMRGMERDAKDFAKALAAAGLAAGGAVAYMVKEAIDGADAINDLSLRLNVQTEILSGYKLVAEQSGSSIDSLGRGMAKLAKEAANNSDALKAMGVETRNADGTLRGIDSILEDVADKFQGYADGAAEAALAQQVLGKAGVELLPILNQGSDALRQAKEDADSLGATIGSDFAADADAFNDNLHLMSLGVQGVANDIAKELLPELIEMSGAVVDAFKEWRRDGTLAEVAQTVKTLAGLTDDLAVAIGVTLGTRAIGGAVAGFATMAKSAGVTAAALGGVRAIMLALGGPAGLLGIAAAGIYYLATASDELTASASEVAEATKAAQDAIDELNRATGAGIDPALNRAKSERERAQQTVQAALADLQAADAALKLARAREDGMSNAPREVQYANMLTTGRAETVLDQQQKEFDALRDSIKALSKEIEEGEVQLGAFNKEGALTPPVVKDITEATDRANKAKDREQKMLDAATKDYKQYKEEVERSAQAILNSLDPIEAIKDAYRQEREVLIDLIGIRQREGQSYGEVVEALVKLRKERDKEIRKAMEAAKPVDQIIKGLADELALMKMGNIERQRTILLRQAGIDEMKVETEKLHDIAAALREIELENNKGLFGSFINSEGFGQAIDTFEDLLGGAIDTAFRDGIEGGLDVLKRGFKEAFKNFENGAESIAGIAQFAEFAVSQFRDNPDAPLRAIASISAQIPGVVGAIAQAVQSIDAIFGGRLLGTNFERDSSALSVRLGQGGFTGNTSVTNVRQQGLFRGREWQTITSALDAQTQQAFAQFFEQMREALEQAASALGGDVGDIVTGSFRQEFDKDGNLVRQLSTVLGRVYSESIEDFQKRLTAENLLKVLEDSIPESLAKIIIDSIGEIDTGGGGGGGVGEATQAMSEVQQIAERWRASASDLLEGAQFLLLAQAAINEGEGLLGGGSLTATADLVEELNQAGETLSETFVRLQSATALFESALSLMGQSLALERDEFVRFAAEIAEAAGGLDRATQLWMTFEEAFYSVDERLQMSIERLTSDADQMLSDLGLSTSISMAEFRAAFEEALPTLTPEQIADYLRAAEVLAQLNDAETELGTIRQSEIDAARELSGLLAGLAEGPMSEFGQDVADINARMTELSAEANELAIAAGRAGASQEELGQITAWAARQFDMAVDRLRDRIQSLNEELYGTELDQIEAQIEVMTAASQEAMQAAEEAQRLNQQRYEQELQYLRSIKQFVDGLLVSSLSPLNPQQQFLEAQQQFEELLGAAQSGDLNALAQIQQAAQTLLEQGQGFFGPSDQFTTLFEDVREALLGLSPTGQPGGPVVTPVPGEELDALFARREALLLEIEARNRESLAQMLASQIGELSAATRESAVALALEMGISLAALVSDLGISLDTLTVETTQELADVARTLNLSVSDLAAAVGVSLGELTETNSLLNDAFEAEIANLPEGIQDELWPLLRAVEDAVTDADANGAINTLRDAVGALAQELRDELAPFLGLGGSTLEPITELRDIVAEYGQQQVDLLTRIADAVDPPEVAPAPELMTVGMERGMPSARAATSGASLADTNRRLDALIAEVRKGSIREANATKDTAQKGGRRRGN